MTDPVEDRTDGNSDKPVGAYRNDEGLKQLTSAADLPDGENQFVRTYSFAEALQCHDFDLSSYAHSQHSLSKNGREKLKSKPKLHSKHKAWKQMKPIRRKKSNKNHLPAEELGLLSFLYVTWLTPLIKKAYRHGLKMDDLWQCGETDSADHNAQMLDEMWKDEVRRKGNDKASLPSVLAKFTKHRVILSVFFVWGVSVGSLFNIVLLQQLLTYIQDNEASVLYGLSLAFALALSEAIKCTLFGAATLTQIRTAMRLRCAIVTLVYQKLLKFQNLQGKAIGEIINLFTNDGDRLVDACNQVHFVFNGPLILLLTVIYTTYVLGPAALCGSSLFFLTWALQAMLSRLLGSFRWKAVRITDTRVRMVSEMTNCIKLIKMYAWEEPFTKKIAEIRQKEKKILQIAGFVESMSWASNAMVQGIAIAVTFVIHIALGNDLTAASAFAVVAMFALTRSALIAAPKAMKVLSEAYVAAKRMQIFLQTAEPQSHTLKPDDDHVAIHISKGTFAWDKNEQNGDEGAKPDREEKLLSTSADISNVENHSSATSINGLFNIDLTLNKGRIIGVCGSVGSGKSSLISAILSQMPLTSGEVKIDGTIAYVSQQAWIFNDTLRENILFGERYEQERYKAAVFASALEEDIKQLPNGDLTEIGERGTNLSGGQKQRVSLARALYADRDIYLLDDPLSAVDAKVGQHIFNYYIRGALKGKSVIFVTHQLQYLSGCDNIYVMKDCRVLESGTHLQLVAADGQYSALLKTFHSDEDKNGIVDDTQHNGNADSNQEIIHKSSKSSQGKVTSHRREHSTDEHNPDFDGRRLRNSGGLHKQTKYESMGMTERSTKFSDSNEKVDGKLMTAEEKTEGSISWKTYHCYVKMAGGYGVVLLVLLLFLLAVGSNAGCTWWLAYWIIQQTERGTNTAINGTETADGITYEREDRDMMFYVYVFLGILAALILFTVLRCVAYVKATFHSSSNLHDQLLKKVFQSPMSFFDTTPSGRIINRFSKDQDEVDVSLSREIENMLVYMSTAVFSCLSILIVFPWMMIALIPFALIIIFTFKYYHHGMRDCKRLDSLTRSPWFCHVTSTMQGLPTIHAYEKEYDFKTKFAKHLDKNTVAFSSFLLCGHWSGVRIDTVAIMTALLTGLMAVLTRGMVSPTLIGVALSYSVQFAGQFQFGIRLAGDAESRMTSVERIYHYLKTLTPEEPSETPKHRPPDNWPSHGKLHVENLAIRYRDNLPLALKGITFNVDSMEKVGIVGRTGAGKSSLGVS
ncbi:ATP-binding cassette sub-family C member 5-like [Ptychodera flava]|uniref:ATP-binding cassette sub-family C member 5-like n=1 Tax=Ptychodera flava TaxID=63121 RepID=UPI00396AA753